MGVEIDVVEVRDKKKVRVIQSEYICSNFIDNPECKKYWYLQHDMDGFDGVRVAERLVKAIDLMVSDGIKIIEGGSEPICDEWQGRKMCDADILSEWMYHLYKFLKIAEDNPEAYFISDVNVNLDIVLPCGGKISLKEARKFPVLYYAVHPVSGLTAIETYADAVEMYNISKNYGDMVNAERWLSLASGLGENDEFDDDDEDDDL
ncbi:MAG: hypothetical protein Harvfovirus40_2 [Harvfovirus sp.]|uniref:Uncharacterized protein n=1 Tax=Harvfovirus sp. TaxID=2487768 RepID=A0A3G5A7W6_9VIRU|nr:MAG: hypothetical protein Harvfovirus40_2 [Harvfovirus sp.]